MKDVTVVLVAVIGVAIVAVLVSSKANTPAVVQAFTQGFSSILGSAVAPVTGGGGVLGTGLSNSTGISLT